MRSHSNIMTLLNSGVCGNIREDLRSKGAPYWFVVGYVPSVGTRVVKQFAKTHIFEAKDASGKSLYPDLTKEVLQKELLDRVSACHKMKLVSVMSQASRANVNILSHSQ